MMLACMLKGLIIAPRMLPHMFLLYSSALACSCRLRLMGNCGEAVQQAGEHAWHMLRRRQDCGAVEVYVHAVHSQGIRRSYRGVLKPHSRHGEHGVGA